MQLNNNNSLVLNDKQQILGECFYIITLMTNENIIIEIACVVRGSKRV